MKDIKLLRKMSYLKLNAQYYQLLYNKEVAQSCLSENFQNAKEISKTYITKEGFDEENLKIYDIEIQLLKYCLDNIKESKRLDSEINDTKIKLLKAEKKVKE